MMLDYIQQQLWFPSCTQLKASSTPRLDAFPTDVTDCLLHRSDMHFKFIQ